MTRERPNTISGLIAKRAELVKYREQLESDIRAVTCDIDHLEAAIRVFDPEDTPTKRMRYAALHRAGRNHSVRFMLERLREASEPLTSRALAEAWCKNRGLEAKDSTVSMIRKRVGATLKAMHHKGLIHQDGFVLGLIGWRIGKKP